MRSLCNGLRIHVCSIRLIQIKFLSPMFALLPVKSILISRFPFCHIHKYYNTTVLYDFQSYITVIFFEFHQPVHKRCKERRQYKGGHKPVNIPVSPPQPLSPWNCIAASGRFSLFCFCQIYLLSAFIYSTFFNASLLGILPILIICKTATTV